MQLGSRLEREGRLVSLSGLGAFLGAGYLLSRDEETKSGVGTTEHLVQERAGLGAEGSVLTPEFLSFRGSGSVGLQHAWAQDPSTSTFDTGDLWEVDAAASFFPRRLYPLDVYVSRNQETRPRVFFSSYETRTIAAGGTQQFRFEGGHLRVGGGHREIVQTLFADRGQTRPLVDSTEDFVEAGGRYKISPEQDIDARYVFRDVSRVPEESSFLEHRLDVGHLWRFGEEKDYELRSRFQGESRDGPLSQDIARFWPTFRFPLAEHLDGDVGGRLEGGKRNDLDFHDILGEAGLQHELFGSLTSTLRARGGQFASGGSTTDRVGGTAGVNYHKKTFAGVLGASYLYDFERRFVEGGGSSVIDEPHTFPLLPPEEVRLGSPGILVTSIFVTDPTGLIVYSEGVDYTVSQDATGTTTTLVRVFGSNIPPGGSILVDYVFVVGADFTLDNGNQYARVHHTFDLGLTPYFEFRRQDQRLRDVSGFGAPTPVLERSLIGGLEWRWSRYHARGEYEDQVSTINPFSAVRLQAGVTHRLGEYHDISASALQTWIFRKDQDRDLSTSDLRLGWRSRVTNNLRFRADTAFRYQDDTLTGPSTGFFAGGELEYLWRRFTLRFRVAYRDTTTDVSGFRGLELSIWIVRTFGAPTRSLRAQIDRMTRL